MRGTLLLLASFAVFVLLVGVLALEFAALPGVAGPARAVARRLPPPLDDLLLSQLPPPGTR